MKGFKIVEGALPMPEKTAVADLSGEIGRIMKKCAQLVNDQESSHYDDENWRKGLLLDVLEVMDSLERIQRQAAQPPENSAMESHLRHVRVTARLLTQVLRRRGVVSFDTLGHPAAPSLTEIVGTEERENCEDEQVIGEVGKGYLWEGRLLRRSKVIVAKKGGPGDGSSNQSHRN